MKTLILAAHFLVLFAMEAEAKCMARFMSTSISESISPKQAILVNMNGEQSLEKLVWHKDGAKDPSDDKKIKFLLVTENQKVNGVIKYKMKGEFRTDQFLIVPEQELKEGATYNIEIEILNQEKKKFELIPNLTFAPFKVLKDQLGNPEAIPLTFPEFVKTSAQMYGCGPDKISTYKAKYNKPMYVLIELRNKKTQEMKTGIEYVSDGQINIGHGMCSGLFTFPDKAEYFVRFKYINMAGIESHFTKYIDFVVPIISERLVQ